jgi:hypothetical protein
MLTSDPSRNTWCWYELSCNLPVLLCICLLTQLQRAAAAASRIQLLSAVVEQMNDVFTSVVFGLHFAFKRAAVGCNICSKVVSI